MSYMNQNKPNYNRNRNQNFEENSFFKVIEQPLHIHYKDKQKLYLEDGFAHQAAKQFKHVSSHQLRKILNQSKLCIAKVNNKEDFEKCVNMLYALLPLTAYNVGRNKKDKELKELYHFMKTHISPKTLTCVEDIETLDEVVTSIVAYHKYAGGAQ